eukprot:1513689-Rhodomonas_salina.1
MLLVQRLSGIRPYAGQSTFREGNLNATCPAVHMQIRDPTYPGTRVLKSFQMRLMPATGHCPGKPEPPTTRDLWFD